jgi:molybdopterin synthase catalytic subunit
MRSRSSRQFREVEQPVAGEYMERKLFITSKAIDEYALMAGRRHRDGVGAVVLFCGVVRGTEGGVNIEGLEYEAFQKMAEHQFNLIFDEVQKRWPVASVRLVHRIGLVLAGETSLWVELTAPHRGEAFAACQYLIDEMKKTVPIWKKAVPD